MQLTESNKVNEFLRYIFGELAPEEVDKIEAHFEANDEDAELFEDLLIFVEDREITSRIAYEEEIRDSKAKAERLWTARSEGGNNKKEI